MNQRPEEPKNSTFVLWYDQNGDPYGVFRRADKYVDDGDVDRWFNVDLYDCANDGGLTWDEVLTEMEGMNGPHRLVRAPFEDKPVREYDAAHGDRLANGAYER
jgi:hypothetical protein